MAVRAKLGTDEVVLVGDYGEFRFNLGRGTFDLVGRGGVEVVTAATSRVLITDRTGAGGASMWRSAAHALAAGYSRRAESTEVTGEFGPGMALEVTCEPEGTGPRQILTASCCEGVPGVFLRLTVENTLGSDVRLDCLEVLHARTGEGASVALLPDPRKVRFYHTGLAMSASPYVDLARPVKDPGERLKAQSSEHMGCFADPAGGGFLLAGFITAARMPVHVRFGLAPGGEDWDEIVALAEAEGRVLGAGAGYESELLYVDWTGRPQRAMERYAELLARAMHAPRSWAPAKEEATRWPGVPTGWCSWYYFYDRVTQEDITSNLEFLAEHRDRYPVEYIQIDNGYQRHWGDWLETSDRFPDGMKALAERICEFGFVPGIWVSPFVASTVSNVARDHPDWLVKDPHGEPIVRPGWGVEKDWYALDGTHPEVQKHLEQTFRVITGEWGYRYVKLDAMHHGARAGAIFHDPSATRAGAYRSGFEAIRRGCTEDTFILGCNAPFGASTGIVHGSRVSPDVAARWRGGCSVHSSLRSSVRRWFFNGRTWWNDPDCLIVRGPERREKRARNAVEAGNLTLEEARTAVAVTGLLGGALFFSDDMPGLTEERAGLLDLLFPPNGRSAVPLDLFERDPPTLLDLHVERPWESYHVVSVTNWGDDETPFLLDVDRLGVEAAPARYHVFELFGERYLGALKGRFDLGPIPAHATRVFAVRRALERPQLVATTLHLTMGGCDLGDLQWREEARTLAVKFNVVCRRVGRVLFHVPGGGDPTLGGTAKAKSHGTEDGLLRVELEVEPRATLEVSFA